MVTKILIIESLIAHKVVSLETGSSVEIGGRLQTSAPPLAPYPHFKEQYEPKDVPIYTSNHGYPGIEPEPKQSWDPQASIRSALPDSRDIPIEVNSLISAPLIDCTKDLARRTSFEDNDRYNQPELVEPYVPSMHRHLIASLGLEDHLEDEPSRPVERTPFAKPIKGIGDDYDDREPVNKAQLDYVAQSIPQPVYANIRITVDQCPKPVELTNFVKPIKGIGEDRKPVNKTKLDLGKIFATAPESDDQGPPYGRLTTHSGYAGGVSLPAVKLDLHFHGGDEDHLEESHFKKMGSGQRAIIPPAFTGYHSAIADAIAGLAGHSRRGGTSNPEEDPSPEERLRRLEFFAPSLPNVPSGSLKEKFRKSGGNTDPITGSVKNNDSCNEMDDAIRSIKSTFQETMKIMDKIFDLN